MLKNNFAESLQQEYRYDRAILLWSRPIVLATTTLLLLPNKEWSWVLPSVAKILQNPVNIVTILLFIVLVTHTLIQ